MKQLTRQRDEIAGRVCPNVGFRRGGERAGHPRRPGTGLGVLGGLLLAVTVGAVAGNAQPEHTFGADLAFMQRHTRILELTDASGRCRVAVAPAYQGRVMTSAAEGRAGASFGWINRELIASGERQAHINIYGGEDRFWIGPEGGQFSIFFAPGAKFDLDHWFTPPALDTEPFRLVESAQDRARFHQQFSLTNYSGTVFQVGVDREVRLLTEAAAWRAVDLPAQTDVHLVGYESRNTLINAGPQPWTRRTGLLSVWILGMFNPGPRATIVAPLRPGRESELGPKVTSDYFGEIPPDRLAVGERAVFFRGDGRFRSKIGLNPRRSRGVLGSYDPDQHLLTIVQFSQPEGVTDYVNSLWKLQEHPFAGDAANSYNDGPASPGAKPFGPFYELESSSPAAALAPGARLSHTHRTLHFVGPESALNPIARRVLGVSLAEIAAALPAVQAEE